MAIERSMADDDSPLMREAIEGGKENKPLARTAEVLPAMRMCFYMHLWCWPGLELVLPLLCLVRRFYFYGLPVKRCLY